jgi:hypothetical protein
VHLFSGLNCGYRQESYLHLNSFCTTMFLSHIKRLCIILPTLIAASPQDTESNSSITNSLPAQLQRTVPACAQPCLLTALQEQYPLSCTTQEDIGCLCSRYSNRGESLGEEALRCIYSSCPTIDKASSAYNVCLGQKNAVRPTQTALTVAATMASSKTSFLTRQTSTFTVPTSTQPTPSDSIVVNSNPSISSTSSSLSTASPTAAPAITGAPPGPKTMTPAQIAGLSVAAVATFIVAIGLMALSIFLRRRKERKEIVDVKEMKTQPYLPRTYSSQYSQLPPRGSSRRTPPKRFPVIPELSAHRSNESLRVTPKKATLARPVLTQINPNTVLYAVPPTASPPNTTPPDYSSVHPLLRPGASRNSSATTVPLDQIGLAISAELPGKSVKPKFPQPPHNAETRPQRPKSLRRSLGLGITNRDDRSSVLTTNTIFEEDAQLGRRRSSMLLPTPPVPIPPIRALQPSRLPPRLNPAEKPLRPSQTHQQAVQQPELFLNIPVRHSRQSPPRISPVDSPQSRDSPKPKAQLAPAINVTSAYSAYKPTTTAASTPETSNIEDIPDYYFTAYDSQRQPSPQPTKTPILRSPISTPSPRRIVRAKDSPKVVVIKAKTSGSTISRATSQASTNLRDSTSSQTSFETTGSNDPTPDGEDDRQLSSGDEKKLSPVAESPISNLRYPKIPRASNQLVPRSPRSPQNLARQQAQLQAQLNGSPRIPSPSTLLRKRRGEREALQLESDLQMSSPKVKDATKKNRSHLRSNSVVESWDAGPNVLAERAARAQSGQWPKSPAMFDTDAVTRPAPLNIKGKRVDEGQLKSPMWVPHLTPTRMGEDLLISVRYSKGDSR